MTLPAAQDLPSSPIEAPPSAQPQRDIDVRATLDTEDLLLYGQAVLVWKGRTGKKRNRSITQFQGPVRDMVEAAANEVESITLFQDLLPDPQRSQVVLETVWTNVELRFKKDMYKKGKIVAYVSSQHA